MNKENNSEFVYCSCQKVYDPSQFYIECDSCDSWFHGKCVRVTSLEAEKLNVWLCPLCTGKRFSFKKLNSRFNPDAAIKKQPLGLSNNNKTGCKRKGCKNYIAKSSHTCSAACTERLKKQKLEDEQKKLQRKTKIIELQKSRAEEERRLSLRHAESKKRLEVLETLIAKTQQRLDECAALLTHRESILAGNSENNGVCGFILALTFPPVKVRAWISGKDLNEHPYPFLCVDDARQFQQELLKPCSEVSGRCLRHADWMELLVDQEKSKKAKLKSDLDHYITEQQSLSEELGNASECNDNIVEIM